MKLYTSNFAKSWNNPSAWAISQGIPKGYKGKRFEALAPPWALVRGQYISHNEYKTIYQEKILNNLDPHKVVKILGDGAIMLCWESADKFCHRFIVADWLRVAGYYVDEIPEKYNYNGSLVQSILRKMETLATYPKHHNQAKKMLIEIKSLEAKLSASEKEELSRRGI